MHNDTHTWSPNIGVLGQLFRILAVEIIVVEIRVMGQASPGKYGKRMGNPRFQALGSGGGLDNVSS